MALEEVPDPACPPDGALVRVVACGICGTDVRAFYNGDRRIGPGWILGHEITGEIAEVGPHANGEVEAEVGELVHVISTLHCGVCRVCRSGNEHLCAEAGLMGFDYAGAYAEYVAVPNVALKNVYRVPEGLDAAASTFADPLSDAICGHKDLGIGPGSTVIVVGAGPIGTAHAALALAEGADVVHLLETEGRRLELAQDVLGNEGVRYVNVAEEDAAAYVERETEDGADVVIVATSNPVAQESALALAAPRGRVLFFGGLPKGVDAIRFPSNVLHYREVSVHGSYASRREDQRRALELLAENAHGVRKIVGERIPLEETPNAFPRLRKGEALKIVVTP